jgi:hypothetical protein
MILAPTLSLNTPARGYDADATAFAAASGATDVAALSAFVKGVKELGLWNSMVCWPLRSSQNAGTGTTAYSLGGLGTFNGTLTNGPTWGVDGVNMVANNRRITTALGPLSQPLTVFSVQAMDASATSGIVYDNTTNAGGDRTHLYNNGNSTDLQIFAGTGVSGGTFTDDVMFAFQVGFNGVSSTYSKDGSTPLTINPGAGAATQFRMGAPSGGAQNGSLLAFCGVITAANTPSLYTLYKQTLGTGLGLP